MRFLCFVAMLFYFLTGSLSAQTRSIDIGQLNKAIRSLSVVKAPSSLLQHKLVVYLFLSPECPLSAYYIPLLNQLHKKDKNVIIAGVVPGMSYSKSDVKNFIAKDSIIFPLFMDAQKKLTTLLGATITPEAVIVANNEHIVYRGAIDDKVGKLGEKRLQSVHGYLINALTELLNNQPVTIAETKAVGCYINDI